MVGLVRAKIIHTKESDEGLQLCDENHTYTRKRPLSICATGEMQPVDCDKKCTI